MICPSCPAVKEMDICRTEFVVTGDNSPNTGTLLFNVPIFKCSNPDCKDKETERRGEPIPLEISKA